MSRRRAATKRKIIPDAKYGNLILARFINNLMKSGKKSAAERIVYSALDSIAQKSKEDPLKVFEEAIENIRPMVEVRSRRVGGATYQVPVEVRQDRSLALSMRWLINASRSRGEQSMAERLTSEVLDAYNKRGNAIKKREDAHKMAEANKAFSHYRW